MRLVPLIIFAAHSHPRPPPLAQKFFGYSGAADYLAATDPNGRLIATFDGFASAADFINASLPDAALINKFAPYSSPDAALRDDPTFQLLTSTLNAAFDPSTYPTTLDSLLDADAQTVDANLDIASKSLFINNVKYRNISDIPSAH